MKEAERKDEKHTSVGTISDRPNAKAQTRLEDDKEIGNTVSFQQNVIARRLPGSCRSTVE